MKEREKKKMKQKVKGWGDRKKKKLKMKTEREELKKYLWLERGIESGNWQKRKGVDSQIVIKMIFFNT